MTEVKKEQGIWNTPRAIDFNRSFLDVDTCRTFTEVIVARGDNPHVIGARLNVGGGRISEIDSMVTKKDDWLFNAVDYPGKREGQICSRPYPECPGSGL